MKFGISYLFIMLFCIRELYENRHSEDCTFLVGVN